MVLPRKVTARRDATGLLNFDAYPSGLGWPGQGLFSDVSRAIKEAGQILYR